MMRTHESPMDFQYDNPLKPDPNSPFSLVSLGKTLNLDKTKSGQLKRDWHDSPTKTTPFSFSTPRTLPHTKATLPANFSSRVDFSAQQDTPGTDNTEDVTDDGGPSEQESPLPAGQRASKRNKLSGLAKLKIKRRRQKYLRDVHHDQMSDDEENDLTVPSSGFPRKEHKDVNSWSMDQHRDLPYIASGYLQLFFNLFLLSIVLYFLVSFIMTIQADVNKKVDEYSAEILSEISICSKEYLENRCSPDQRVPAMQMACQAWEKCMERDPAKVGRARVSAETFAEIVNSLIEPISYKTMVFCLMLIFGSLFISNFAFGLLRQKHHQSSSHGPSTGIQPATFMIQATPHQQGRRSEQQQVMW